MMGKKLTNNGPLKESADKHSICTIEIVIELCHEGQRQPYIDNGRRLPWRAADTALWRRGCLDWGHLVGLHCHHPALRWGHTVLLLSEGAYILFYHINYYCGIKYL